MSRVAVAATCLALDIGHLSGWKGCMNNQEVIMCNALLTTGLIAHHKALEAAGIAISIVMRVPAPLKSIADQVIRSAASVPANLADCATLGRQTRPRRPEPVDG